MTRILLVENDSAVRTSLVLLLEHEGFSPALAATAAAARLELDKEPFELALLDEELSDCSSAELSREIRDRCPAIPIVLLKKPFGNQELVEQLRGALGKSGLERIACGPIVIDLGTRKAEASGKELVLNRRELDILAIFARRPGTVVTRDEIIQRLGPAADIFDRTIDSHLSHLRGKLRRAGVAALSLQAVYGVGYRLDVKA